MAANSTARDASGRESYLAIAKIAKIAKIARIQVTCWFVGSGWGRIPSLAILAILAMLAMKGEAR
jgi:hypothetical protein